MRKLKARTWVVSFAALVLVLVLLFSALVYLIDPFFQFRVKDNAYMLSAWFVGSGLIENYDYDTLILGSSMTQNFDMDVFRRELGAKPLHVGLSDMRVPELSDLIHVAYDAKRAERYYICVDLTVFTKDDTESRYPAYLLKKDPLSRLRYFLSYEAWFRYIPIDLSFMLLDGLEVELPEKFAASRSIDLLEDYRADVAYGKDIVLGNYNSGAYAVSAVDTDNLYQRMCVHIDDYLARFDFEKGAHVFFFPPYSSLYWCDSQDYGYFDVYMRAKAYFVARAAALGAMVYDFQCTELAMDLDNYKDTTHYSPEINDWMVRCFAKGDYLATPENCDSFREKLMENTQRFREAYAELFD